MSLIDFRDDGKERYQSITATVSWQGYDSMSTFDFTLTGYGKDEAEAEYHLRRALKDQLKAMSEVDRDLSFSSHETMGWGMTHDIEAVKKVNL